ncbi:MAG: hypothetical protein LAP87_13425 [Acidobacteriia bacterium]|nr:hypothetical protein [Terriglobia bacterium]
MISNLDPAAELFLADANRIQQRIATANSQVSSGKRIVSASDAPDEIGSLLQLRSNLQRNTQIQSNLGLAKADADGADNALSAAIKLMDSALSIAAQGANSTMAPETIQNLAPNVQAILEEMVAYSQTAVDGRYIFSGDQDASPAYALNAAAANGVAQLLGTQATRQIENPAGGSFAAAKTAQEIFDARDQWGAATGDNVFAALSGLQAALAAGDPQQVTGAIASIKQASSHLNSMEAFYGTVQNRIQNAADFADSYGIRLQTEISQTEDADLTSAALELTQANTQLQASFQMRAKMPHTSLFDFLG